MAGHHFWLAADPTSLWGNGHFASDIAGDLSVQVSAMGLGAVQFGHWVLTGGAQAPVDDLGLVDEETMVVVCGGHDFF